jgi:hypothetical protein
MVFWIISVSDQKHQNGHSKYKPISMLTNLVSHVATSQALVNPASLLGTLVVLLMDLERAAKPQEI